MNDRLLSCPLCSSGQVEEYLRLPDRFRGEGELYVIYRCRSCGFIFLHPLIPENEMAEHYAFQGYDPFSEVEETGSFSQKIYARAKPFGLNWKARLINRYQPQPGRILDVGAGTGAFLKRMRTEGWEVVGIEKDDKAAAYARSDLGIEVYTGDLADKKDIEGDFDAVTFWHSLEHIHRFRENLKAAEALLKREGYLYIALPNHDSLDAGVYKNRWAAWDAPRHLWHFNPASFGKLMGEFGFKVKRVYSMPLDPFYHTLLSEFMSGGGVWWRYPLRLPIVSSLSFIWGIIDRSKGSSLVYLCRR